MPTLRLPDGADPPWLEKARREGRIVSEVGCKPEVNCKPETREERAASQKAIDPYSVIGTPKAKQPQLVAPLFAMPGTFIIPLKVNPGDNARGQKSRIGRSGHERRACYAVFALGHAAWATFCGRLATGHPLVVLLTRLGGRALDAHDGLPAACKYVADAVADYLGIDDADPRVAWHYDQRPGGPHGVKVELM